MVQSGTFTGDQAKIGVLPTECRPGRRLVFEVAAHAGTQRVDVLKDGTIAQMGPSAAGSAQWTSLEGIVFPVAEAPVSSLELATGWALEGALPAETTGPLQVLEQGGLCLLTGLVYSTADSPSTLATLPPECAAPDGLLLIGGGNLILQDSSNIKIEGGSIILSKMGNPGGATAINVPFYTVTVE